MSTESSASHRPTQDDQPSTRGLPTPTPDLVVQLQGERQPPSVSLLLNTTAAEEMTQDDRSRLRAQLDEARRRLRSFPVDSATSQRIHARLEREVQRVSGARTEVAVAVYAGPTMAMSLSLGVPVADRVVVDPSFATRDLVRALHRTPRHAVLVVDWDEARLYDGRAGTLTPVGGRFPLSRARYGEDTEQFLRDVDRAFGTYLAVHPSPVVVAGRASLLQPFLDLSRNTQRLAGKLSIDPATTPSARLAAAVGPLMQAYLLSRQREAIDLVARSRGRGVLASGMVEAWRSARGGYPEMLAVEEGLFYPARVLGDGHRIEPTTDIEDPEVIDDAVDELIELVLSRGGWIAFAEEGLLAEHEGVALVLRPSEP